MNRNIIARHNNNGTVTISEEGYKHLIDCAEKYNTLVNVTAERAKTMEAVKKMLEKE